jgi:hypothetical protein
MGIKLRYSDLTVAIASDMTAFGATAPFALTLAKVGNPPPADLKLGYQMSDFDH